MRLSSQGASEMRGLIERQELELIALRARVAELYRQLREDARDFADRIEALEGLLARAQRIIDPCYPEASNQWQKDARAALKEEKP